MPLNSQPRGAISKSPSKTKKPAEPTPPKPPERTVPAFTADDLNKPIPGPVKHHLFDRIVSVMRARGTDYPSKSEEGFGIGAFAGLKPSNQTC